MVRSWVHNCFTGIVRIEYIKKRRPPVPDGVGGHFEFSNLDIVTLVP